MVINISKETFKSRIMYIWTLVIILIIVAIIFMVNKTNYILFGKRMPWSKQEKILNNIQTYYIAYDMTIVSNKNINTYAVKEWFKEGTGYRLDYLDYLKNNMTIVTTENKTYIKNDANKLELKLPNNYGENNISSFATFLKIYNSLGNMTCGCKKETYEKKGETIININLCNSNSCLFKNLKENLSIGKLVLEISKNMPYSYTIYDINQKEYICIVYNIFEINKDIEEEIFRID